MQIVIDSIVSISPETRTTAFGQYRVALKVDDRVEVLTYTVELGPGGGQATRWAPPNSILSDTRVDVLIVASVSDTVVAFHQGKNVQFPKEMSPVPIGPDTAVIRL